MTAILYTNVWATQEKENSRFLRSCCQIGKSNLKYKQRTPIHRFFFCRKNTNCF